MYCLVNYHNDCGFATDVGPSQRKDVDELCKQACVGGHNKSVHEANPITNHD